MAESVGSTPYRINVNDNAFLAPKSMMGAVREACGAPDMPLDELLCCVYHSLSDYYAKTISELKEISGRPLDALHIIGGGSQDTYLSKLTAQKIDMPVYTGPVEATAIGNILAQMLATGVFANIAQARSAVFESFDVKKVEF